MFFILWKEDSNNKVNLQKQRDMGNVRRKQRKTWEYGIVTCNKDHYVREYAFPPVSSRCVQRVVSTSIIVFSRVSIVNLIDYAFCKKSGIYIYPEIINQVKVNGVNHEQYRYMIRTHGRVSMVTVGSRVNVLTTVVKR